MKYAIPPYAKKILNVLNAAGYEAYIAGGAVRDLLLGRPPGDFDATTSALPEETAAVCKAHDIKTVDNLGQNFGCVVAVIEGHNVEITTFRGESYGSDAHKPEKVWFSKSLRDDLSRRDFTVNAMVMDADGKIYDYHCGQEDLAKKILRTVGDAQTRYSEDALRMLRACRFVGQLGFTYVQGDGLLPPFGEEGTPYYLPQNFKFPVERCAGLSLERVRTELDKLLLSEYAGHGLMLLMATGLTDAHCRIKEGGSYTEIAILPELRHLAGLPQNRRFHCYNAWEHTLAAVDNSPRDLTIRWAMLLHDLGKGMPGIRGTHPDGSPSDHGHEALSAVMAEELLTRLRYPKDFKKRVVWLVSRHMRFAPMMFTKERTLMRWVRAEAASGEFRTEKDLTEAFTQLKEVFLADMGATHAGKNPQLMAEGRELADAVIELARTKMPVHTSDLAISGADLHGTVPQEETGAYLKYLLTRVQSGNLANCRDELLAAAKHRRNKTETVEN